LIQRVVCNDIDANQFFIPAVYVHVKHMLQHSRDKYIEDIQVFSINTWFIFIEWYENKYFMSGGSHEWIMVIFMPQDENKSCTYRKKLEFSVYYIQDIKICKTFP
jgi:hypothetical protein